MVLCRLQDIMVTNVFEIHDYSHKINSYLVGFQQKAFFDIASVDFLWLRFFGLGSSLTSPFQLENLTLKRHKFSNSLN